MATRGRWACRLSCVWICLLLCVDLSAGLLDGFGLDSQVVREESKYTCTPVPPAKPPAQHSGAEGLGPLPLPAVPLRRTEKKNPPRPPVLIAKIATKRRSDWATNPADSKNLLRWMSKTLNVHFSAINVPEQQMPTDPKEVPVLYRTGHEAFSFSDDTRQNLRAYLRQGGTIIFDACCGRRASVESALTEMQKLIPERPAYRLTLDHPLYHSFFEVKSINYRSWASKAGAQAGEPSGIAIDIGCRTAAFFFRWDVSCGWELAQCPYCAGVASTDALALGVNILSYAVLQ